MARTSKVLSGALLFAFLAWAMPTATAQPETPEPVECLAGPQIPETPVYYIVWYCTVGDAVPEPLDYFLNCHITFPLGLDCLSSELPDCRITVIPEEPVVCVNDPRENCVQMYPASELCQGDVQGFVRAFLDPTLG